jgi:hypothetical protein
VARRMLLVVGALLAVLGVFAAGASLATPWARGRPRGTAYSRLVEVQGDWSIFSMSGGLWYVALVLGLAGLAGAAALSTGRLRMVAGIAAPILGLGVAIAVVALVGHFGPGNDVATAAVGVDPRVAVGAWFGLLAAPALGFGAGLLAIGRTGEPGHASATAVVAGGHD